MENPLKVLAHKLKLKSPQELVQRTQQAFARLPYETNPDRIVEDLGKYLNAMKLLMFGDENASATKETALTIAYETCKTDLLTLMARWLPVLQFEARKDAAQLFGAVVRLENKGEQPGVQFVSRHPECLETLFNGYNNPEIALNCGSMLRDCIRNEELARQLLHSDMFPDFFKRVEVSNFEIASDAFTTFRDLLTRHKAMVARYFTDNYDEFFQLYTNLLKSENYVTRRQSLKLLGELLLDRSNVHVMMRYVTDVNNLMLLMNLLKDTARSIQFEAFHVFKVFVANPKKTKPITNILANNKDKLVKYLGDFHAERDDEQFRDEKAVIIKEISVLQPIA